MKRSRRVAVVAHCLLDANTRVHGIASWKAVHPKALELIEQGYSIVQLPCPEATYLGMGRPAMAWNVYDTYEYRRHCEEILLASVDTVEELIHDGCEVVVVGLEGSPSCAINRPCRGVMVGKLAEMLGGRGLEPPFSEAE